MRFWLLGHKGLGVEFLPGAPASELKWRESHESPKFVDSAIPAPLPKAISKASGLLDIQVLGTAYDLGSCV